MRRLRFSTLTLALATLAGPFAAVTACGGDDPADKNDPPAEAGGTGNNTTGATSGEGATGAVGATSSTGATGAMNGDGGAGNSGSGAAGGTTGTPDGGAGGGENPPTCDLSGDGKSKESIPTDGAGVLEDDVQLTSDTVWKIDNYVYVPDGVTLTIDPCTRIEGDEGTKGTLIVRRGGKIMAEGTADEPILFTSENAEGDRTRGDWGGIVVLGKATNGNLNNLLIEGVVEDPLNHHGGDDDNDDSGVMTYVRIEFAGTEIEDGKEINGLSLGSVGDGTTINHIMVNTTLDDCFELFGGTVNLDHLVCNNGGDDMFDTDDGYRGELTYLFGRQVVPYKTDPNGFEWDGVTDYAGDPDTSVTASNITLCGIGSASPPVSGPAYGMRLRRGVTGDISKAVVLGFNPGGANLTEDFTGISITDSVFFDNAALGPDQGSIDWFDDESSNNTDDPGFTVEDCGDEAGPTADVTDSDVGAFEGGDWLTAPWIDWATE